MLTLAELPETTRAAIPKLTVSGSVYSGNAAQRMLTPAAVLQLRGLMQGKVPYLDTGDYPVLEYPVLTGWFVHLERVISSALGAPNPVPRCGAAQGCSS